MKFPFAIAKGISYESEKATALGFTDDQALPTPISEQNGPFFILNQFFLVRFLEFFFFCRFEEPRDHHLEEPHAWQHGGIQMYCSQWRGGGELHHWGHHALWVRLALIQTIARWLEIESRHPLPPMMSIIHRPHLDQQGPGMWLADLTQTHTQGHLLGSTAAPCCPKECLTSANGPLDMRLYTQKLCR